MGQNESDSGINCHNSKELKQDKNSIGLSIASVKAQKPGCEAFSSKNGTENDRCVSDEQRKLCSIVKQKWKKWVTVELTSLAWASMFEVCFFVCWYEGVGVGIC